MIKRWNVDEESGRRFRNIPLNLADQYRAIFPWTLVRLQREFDILWDEGVIWEDET